MVSGSFLTIALWDTLALAGLAAAGAGQSGLGPGGRAVLWYPSSWYAKSSMARGADAALGAHTAAMARFLVVASTGYGGAQGAASHTKSTRLDRLP